MRQHPQMIASKRDDEIGGQVVVAHLRRAVLGRIAVLTQDGVGAFVGRITGMPVAGAATGHPDKVAQAALLDLVGEHLLGHRRAADVARADECDMQELRHRAPRVAP